MRCEREAAGRAPRFLVSTTGRRELPLIQLGKTGGQSRFQKGGLMLGSRHVKFWTPKRCRLVNDSEETGLAGV